MTKIYLGGKIAANDWRHTVVPTLREAGSYRGSDGISWIDTQWQPTRTTFPNVHYIGPYFTGCDHACAHGRSTHGFLEEPVCGQDCPHDQVKTLCLDAIGNADVFFAWLGGEEVCTAYGTLAELGYAKGTGATVITAAPSWNQDLWFAHKMADLAFCVPDPIIGVQSALIRLGLLSKVESLAWETFEQVEERDRELREWQNSR